MFSGVHFIILRVMVTNHMTSGRSLIICLEMKLGNSNFHPEKVSILGKVESTQ